MATIKSGASSDLLTIDGTSKAARATLYDTAGNALLVADDSAIGATQSGLLTLGKNDDTARMVRVDRVGNTRIAFPTILFDAPVEGTTLNTQNWQSVTTTMTVTQAVTNILLNASAITTINTGALIQSWLRMPLRPAMPLRGQVRARSTLVANQVGWIGFGDQSTATGDPSNAYAWKFGSDGSVKPAVWYAGAEVTLGTDISGSLTNTNYYIWEVIREDDRVTFICQRSDTGAIVSEQVIRFALTQQRLANVTHIPWSIHVRNTGSAPATAGQLFVGSSLVKALDINLGIPFPMQQSLLSLGSELSPTAYTQAAQFANSAAPANATLSNTAAGYSTLGGLWAFAAVAGAVTDYALFSWANPTPYRFVCTGITIQSWNTVVAVATTPTLMVWGLGFNGASANLATGGHLRIALGAQSLPIGAVAGAVASDPINIEFPQGYKTEPGRHLTTILRMPVATATATEVIAGLIKLRGYYI